MKQSKKRWAWTEKYLRKARSKSWRHTAPTWYCKLENKTYKTNTKNSLHKIKLGYNPDYMVLEFGRTNHKHSATWNWW